MRLRILFIFFSVILNIKALQAMQSPNQNRDTAPGRADRSLNWRNDTAPGRADRSLNWRNDTVPGRADRSLNWRSDTAPGRTDRSFNRIINNDQEKTDNSEDHHLAENKPTIVTVGQIALGLPIKENKNVFLKTTGLSSCTGLIITDEETNTLLVHIYHEDNVDEIVNSSLEKIKQKSGKLNYKGIKIKVYYTLESRTEGQKNAEKIITIAKEIGLDAESILIYGDLTTDILGRKTHDPNNSNIINMENYSTDIEDEIRKKYTKNWGEITNLQQEYEKIENSKEAENLEKIIDQKTEETEQQERKDRELIKDEESFIEYLKKHGLKNPWIIVPANFYEGSQTTSSPTNY